MKRHHVVLIFSIGLILMLCFSGTAPAAEPIHIGDDPMLQETEYATLQGQGSASASVLVCGYIIPQASGSASASKPIPKTGDTGFQGYPLVLTQAILLVALILRYLTARDGETERTVDACEAPKT